jgi:hypothetical protein
MGRFLPLRELFLRERVLAPAHDLIGIADYEPGTYSNLKQWRFEIQVPFVSLDGTRTKRDIMRNTMILPA